MKRHLLSVIACSVVALGFAGCQTTAADPYGLKDKTHTAVTPADRADVKWWMPRHQKVLSEISAGPVDMIWIGDSITHSWENQGKAVWEQYYDKRNAVNMGFGGDRTQHVLWRLEHGEIDGISPKAAVLMIGTNNSGGADNTAEEIADGIKAICAKLRSKLPKTKILILAIFPRGDTEQRNNKVQAAAFNEQWAKNKKASELASTIADGKHIYYLDINDKFLDAKGRLPADIMPDLLHPNEKGYQIWAQAIESQVRKLMEEK